MEWVENTLIDPTDNTEKERQTNNSQAITVTAQTEASNKRTRNEEFYSAETIVENKFKIIYNKKEKMIVAEKEKVIEIYGTDDQKANNDQQTDDEATIIVNETLVEIQKDQISTQEQDREIVGMQVNSEAPSSSKAAEETDSDIQKKHKQIKERNEDIENEFYSQFLK